LSTQRERDEKRRQEKLENVKQQVEDGSLVIRKMTDAERKANPVRPPKPKKPYRR
jgi:anti-sigma28 factor (negative regulator of flagellin synthesis)